MRGAPIIAHFEYKDEHINYKCDIRIRKFYMDDKRCQTHGSVKSKSLNCDYCGKPLDSKKVSLYCLYVGKAPDFVKVQELLTRYTCMRWRLESFKMGMSQIRAFANSVGKAEYSLALSFMDKFYTYGQPNQYNHKFILDVKDKDEKIIGEWSITIFQVLEQLLDQKYNDSQKLKMIRAI